MVGAVFLATPFQGSDDAKQASWLVTIKGIMGERASNQLIQDLEQKHDYVRQRIQRFTEIANANSIRLPIRCFYEQGEQIFRERFFHRASRLYSLVDI
jgi:hypothetical protein